MNASQGRSKTPEYAAWRNMLKRVEQPSYADRGITVCERWRIFENFLLDVGERPEGMSLGRIDNDGDFEPGNCHWTTWSAIVKSRPASAASLANLRPGQGSKATHGHNRDNGKSPTYRTWDNMIQRCTNPKTPGYRYYAERGITVCERWRTFASFLEDMGERPEGKTLDRWPDNDGGYWCGHCDECVRLGRPSNCRWATWSEQMKNRRPSAASLANLRHGSGGEAAVAAALARAGLEVPQ